MHKKIKLPVQDNNGKKTLIRANKELVNNRQREIVFSFSKFQKESIRCKDFNNFYPTKLDAVNAIKDFFVSSIDLSKRIPDELFDYSLKEQYHYNEFDDQTIIKRIENVLIDGYQMNSKIVEQLEGMYFEFYFSNGKRAIGTKIDENIFSILFLDPNHLICKESSRNVKMKERFMIPTILEGWDNSIEVKNEVSKNDYIKIIIESMENNTYEKFEEVSNDLKDVLDISDI